MANLPLFDAPDVVLRARRGDPATSHAAMAALDPKRMQSAAAAARACHIKYGPLADFEFALLWSEVWPFPCSAHLYRQARCIARDNGWIRDSGTEKLFPKSKKHQTVWEACDVAPPVIERCQACGHVLGRRPSGGANE